MMDASFGKLLRLDSILFKKGVNKDEENFIQVSHHDGDLRFVSWHYP